MHTRSGRTRSQAGSARRKVSVIRRLHGRCLWVLVVQPVLQAAGRASPQDLFECLIHLVVVLPQHAGREQRRVWSEAGSRSAMGRGRYTGAAWCRRRAHPSRCGYHWQARHLCRARRGASKGGRRCPRRVERESFSGRRRSQHHVRGMITILQGLLFVSRRGRWHQAIAHGDAAPGLIDGDYSLRSGNRVAGARSRSPKVGRVMPGMYAV